MRNVLISLGILVGAITACRSDAPTLPRASEASSVRMPPATTPLEWLRHYLQKPKRAASDPNAPALLAGAGDIARCYPGEDVSQFSPPGSDNPATQTAKLLQEMPDAIVMAVGDNAYEFGSPLDYSG